MVRYWLVFASVLLSLTLSCSVNGVEVKDLYVAKVPVVSQSRDDRNLALKAALSSVLVKVGGQKSVLSHPSIKSKLGRYQSYVTNYRYERNNGKQFLRASFDQSKINALFVDANLPIWGSLRPQVVLWLVNEQGLTRQLISDGSDSDLVNAVSEFSSSRGLPIVLPSDEEVTAVSDVWGRFKEPLFLASKPYAPEAILIIRVSDNTLLSEQQIESADACQLLCQQAISLDWSFISTVRVDDTQRFSERYQGVNRAALLTQALSDITDDVYQRYALTTGENNQFEMDVANVDSLARYVKVTEFLQELSSVQSVKLVSASGSLRRFSLTLIGSEQTLLDSLKLDNALSRYIDPLDPSAQEGVPLFYWEQP